MTTLDRFRLDGKVAIVTGGGGAIGQVYGRALAEAGAASRSPTSTGEAAASAADELERDGSGRRRARRHHRSGVDGGDGRRTPSTRSVASTSS